MTLDHAKHVVPKRRLKDHAIPQATGAYLDVFFGELKRCGVHDVVISPGSRSTPLVCKAFEHYGDVYVDVDERGAAFFALGLAKAQGTPVAVVCTSGTAPGNWMPAVLEAEASRVPLLLLSADRPPRLQNIGAAQTCDQKHLFGSHVRRFYQMPLPSFDSDTLSYARQIAMDACSAANGAVPGAASCDGAPVHINFPFDEPLAVPRRSTTPTETIWAPPENLPASVVAGQMLFAHDATALARMLDGKRALALCGEGTCSNSEQASMLLQFAHAYQLPLLADPLSGLRCYDDPLVIDAYDAVCRAGNQPDDPEVIVRFGRWPVSKALREIVSAAHPTHIAVDVRESRDATATSSMHVRTTPEAFARSMVQAAREQTYSADGTFCAMWQGANESARHTIAQVRTQGANDFEGSYVNQLIEMAPEYSLLFCANSMSIRALDTFYLKDNRSLTVLANRGLAGIDGTLSTALGAAQAFEQTTVLVGDLAFLHDMNALALQRELFTRAERAGTKPAPITIVVLNNNGGGIFDVLPQNTKDAAYERLFFTPHDMLMRHAALTFNISHSQVATVGDFRREYALHLGVPGISIIEVTLPLEGVANRYAPYWGTTHNA